jgi:hypothetical protein
VGNAYRGKFFLNHIQIVHESESDFCFLPLRKIAWIMVMAVIFGKLESGSGASMENV